MTRVSLAAFFALATACTGGDPVTELGQVFSNRPVLETPGQPASDGGATTPATTHQACVLSAVATSSLLLYFPLDSDVASHGGTVSATLMGNVLPRFAPGKINRGLAGAASAFVALSPEIPFQSYTVCAWVAPGATEDVVTVLSDPSGSESFSFSASTLRRNDFNLVCWVGEQGVEGVVIDGTRVAGARSEERSALSSLRLGGGESALVDEITVFGLALDSSDLAALYAGGRGCLPGALQ